MSVLINNYLILSAEHGVDPFKPLRKIHELTINIVTYLSYIGCILYEIDYKLSI